MFVYCVEQTLCVVVGVCRLEKNIEKLQAELNEDDALQKAESDQNTVIAWLRQRKQTLDMYRDQAQQSQFYQQILENEVTKFDVRFLLLKQLVS